MICRSAVGTRDQEKLPIATGSQRSPVVLELPAAIRAATHRAQDPVPEPVARRVINRFDRAVTGKILLRKEVDMRESVAMARSLGGNARLAGKTHHV